MPSSLISMLCLMVYMLSPIISMLRVVVSAAFLLVQILHHGVHILLPMIPCNQRLRVQAKYHKMLKNALPWPPGVYVETRSPKRFDRETVPKRLRIFSVAPQEAPCSLVAQSRRARRTQPELLTGRRWQLVQRFYHILPVSRHFDAVLPPRVKQMDRTVGNSDGALCLSMASISNAPPKP